MARAQQFCCYCIVKYEIHFVQTKHILRCQERAATLTSPELFRYDAPEMTPPVQLALDLDEVTRHQVLAQLLVHLDTQQVF